MIDIAVFQAIPGETGEPLEEFSLKDEYRPEEWRKGRFKGVVQRGTYRGLEIVLAQTGIWSSSGRLGNTQAKEVAEFVLNRFPVEKIVILGTSGGMKESLKTGDIVICDPIFAERRFLFWTRILPPIFPDSRLQALAIKILKEKSINFYNGGDLMIPYYGWPKRRYPDIAVIEMEDYYIGEEAKKKKVPFVAVRVVSEPFGEEIIPREKRTKEYQAWLDARYRKITTILRDGFLLPFLQQL